MTARAWSRWGVVTVCVLLASVAWTLMAWNGTEQQMRRFNLASSRSLELWHVYGGLWQVEDNQVRNNSDDRGAKLVAGSESWRDYRYTADLRFDSEHGDMGMVVRASHVEQGADSYDGYYVGLRTVDGMLVAGRSDYGWIEARPIAMPGGIHAGPWYRVVVTVVGCHLAASAENLGTHQQTAIAIEDADCLPSGAIGVRSFATGGTWRNLRVQPADRTDAVRAEAAAGGLRRLELPRREADYNRDYHFSGAAPVKMTTSMESDAKAWSLVHIADVATLPRDGVYPVRLHGVVTLTAPYLYVQDAEGAILVRPVAPVRLNVGDEVEVTGDAVPKPFANAIERAHVRLLWTGTSVPPIAVTPSQAASGAYEAKFVETEARLVAESEDAKGNQVLELTDDSQNFRVLLGARMAHIAAHIEKNSLLRVHGICVLDRDLTGDLSPFVLLPLSADDVQVLASAPWWTPWHVGLCVVGIVLLVAFAQMSYYRMHQWRARAVTEERERLAHEIHDTMAQSFAGVGYQIQGIRTRVVKGERMVQAQIVDQLDVAYQLVRRCHVEASRTIAMLGKASPEVQSNLLGLLGATAQRIAGSAIEVRIAAESELSPLPLRMANALHMIGQEAIANALGHGEATALELSLRRLAHTVELAVRDNGKGFDTTRIRAGFGLQGMQKRARDLGGVLKIESVETVGTTITATAPLPRGRAFAFTGAAWIRRVWQRWRLNASA